jgi:hypothetical protein
MMPTIPILIIAEQLRIARGALDGETLAETITEIC